MNKEWLTKLASDIEAKHGAIIRDRIFGNIKNLPEDDTAICSFFHKLVTEMDELDDREFLTSVMAENCPCGHRDFEVIIKKTYDESNTLEEFAERLDRGNLIEDLVSLDGNILTLTKHPFEKYGEHKHSGLFTKGCHCELASHAKEPISSTFCHCCTVGFYGKMFKNALGVDVKVEFIDSVIIGGKGCTAVIHLPLKQSNEEGDEHE